MDEFSELQLRRAKLQDTSQPKAEDEFQAIRRRRQESTPMESPRDGPREAVPRNGPRDTPKDGPRGGDWNPQPLPAKQKYAERRSTSKGTESKTKPKEKSCCPCFSRREAQKPRPKTSDPTEKTASSITDLGWMSISDKPVALPPPKPQPFIPQDPFRKPSQPTQKSSVPSRDRQASRMKSAHAAPIVHRPYIDASYDTDSEPKPRPHATNAPGQAVGKKRGETCEPNTEYWIQNNKPPPESEDRFSEQKYGSDPKGITNEDIVGQLRALKRVSKEQFVVQPAVEKPARVPSDHHERRAADRAGHHGGHRHHHADQAGHHGGHRHRADQQDRDIRRNQSKDDFPCLPTMIMNDATVAFPALPTVVDK